MRPSRSKRNIKRLKKWLIDLDMTQEEIARECEVDQASVSYAIYGKRNVRKVIEFFLAKGCPSDIFEEDFRRSHDAQLRSELRRAERDARKDSREQTF
jgi:transcriptional regulator with XRE-family HTH domain